MKSLKVIKMQKNSKDCIICGFDNPLGLKAKFYELEDGSVGTIVKFRNEHQSYPTRTHGGMISALLDELMGRVIWVNEPQTFGVTTTLNITYRKPVPLETPVKARGYLVFESPRGMSAKGQIFDMDNNLLAEGNCKYFKLPFEKVFGENTNMHEELCYLPDIDIKQMDFPID